MKKTVSILAALVFALLLLLFPGDAAGAVREALALCAQSVLPSLFPFLIAVELLCSLGFSAWLQRLCGPMMGPLFSLRGACAMPLLAGLLGGYPTGAATAAALHEQGLLSRTEAEKLLGFCNNCGPAFILGYTASILGDSSLGWRLWAVHLLSALVTGVLLCRPGRGKTTPALSRPLPAPVVSPSLALTGAVKRAVTASLNICAWVVLFRVLAALLPLPGWTIGALELVSGVAALPPGRAGFIAAAGLLAWGGLSVHCQTMTVIGDLPAAAHLRGKLLQSALSVLLAWLLAPV